MLSSRQRKTLLEMVRDRGYNIGPIADHLDEYSQYTELDRDRVWFTESYQLSSSQSHTVQSLYNNLKKTSNKVEVSIYESDRGTYLLTFVGYSTLKTGRFPEEILTPLVNLLNKLRVEIDQIVIVLDQMTDLKKAAKLDNYGPKITFFTKSELYYNPSHHDFAPRLYLAEGYSEYLQTEKKFLIKRVESDILCRYYGFKAGQILIEESPVFLNASSMIDSQSFIVRVI